MVEQQFRHGRRGKSLRPFQLTAGVKNRGYSRLLERAIVDFGADVSFQRVPSKFLEHYGFEVPATRVRQITEAHAGQMLAQQSLQEQMPEQAGVPVVVAEIDGSMIPIVQTAAAPASQDRRRVRKLGWQEARLALAYAWGTVSPRFGATLGGPAEAGAQWKDCVIRAGAGSQTYIHGVGDGAPWIFEQKEQQFGTQAHYLIDFSHLSDYWAAAAPACCPDNPQGWLAQQQEQLKLSQVEQVLDALVPFLERTSAAAKKEEAPVQACYRYMENRPGQFDYRAALAKGLPIGSGKIESGHRYVVQSRLKLAGAWWTEENAASMMALRVVRANNEWDAYWADSQKKAA